MTLTEIVRLRPQEQAKFQCSACGADRGCDCNAPAVEKLARKAEQDRINQRAYRERKRAALDNAPIDFVKDSPSAEALLSLRAARRREATGNDLPVDTRVGLDGKVRNLPKPRSRSEDLPTDEEVEAERQETNLKFAIQIVTQRDGR
jgi:hypothetical protein